MNVLPGKDGLLHISKLGRGKRIDRVEDVLNLGDEVSVRVDDIDNAGKLSLSLVGDDDGAGPEGSSGGSDRVRAPAREPVSVGAGERSAGGGGGADSGREVVSFEDTWEDTAKNEFGDLGPDDGGSAERSGGGGGGGARRGGRRGGRR